MPYSESAALRSSIVKVVLVLSFGNVKSSSMKAGLAKANLGSSRARHSRASPSTRRICTYAGMLVCIAGDVRNEFLSSKGEKAFSSRKRGMSAHVMGKEGICSQADIFAFEPDSVKIIIRDLVRDLG